MNPSSPETEPPASAPIHDGAFGKSRIREALHSGARVYGTHVARIFPNEASLLRILSALLAETSDDSLSSKAYLDMHPSTPPSV